MEKKKKEFLLNWMLNYFKCRGESAFLYHSRRCRRYLPVSKYFLKLFCGQFPCKLSMLIVCLCVVRNSQNLSYLLLMSHQ